MQWGPHHVENHLEMVTPKKNIDLSPAANGMPSDAIAHSPGPSISFEHRLALAPLLHEWWCLTMQHSLLGVCVSASMLPGPTSRSRLVEDGAADVAGIIFGVSVVAADVAGGVGTRIDGSWAGRGCGAWVVVFFAGSKAERGIVLWSKGWILVFLKADLMVVGLRATVQAL